MVLDRAVNFELRYSGARPLRDLKTIKAFWISRWVLRFFQFTAKFVVSRCEFCKLRRGLGFFCSVNHFSKGGVNANHTVTWTSCLAKNDSRLLKNSEGNHDGEWIFCRRKEADVTLFLQVTRMRKIIKICEANLTSPKKDDHNGNEPWNMKQTKRIEIHPQVNMCFLRGPLRWVKKQKNPKYVKRTAWYNELRYKFWNSCDAFVPWVPEGFFSCSSLRRKLRGEAAIVKSGKERFFFPARHDRGFAAQFSPQTKGTNPLAPRGMHLHRRRSLRKLELALHDFRVFEVCLRVLCHSFHKQHYNSRDAAESRIVDKMQCWWGNKLPGLTSLIALLQSQRQFF